MPDERIEAQSYSGYKAEETPRFFIFRGKKIVIIKIIDMWTEEDAKNRDRKRFFEIEGDDGFKYRLYLDEKTQEWFIQSKKS